MIRVAVEADISELIECGRRFFEATDLSKAAITYDEDSAAKTFYGLIQDPASVVFIAENEQGKMSGMAGATVHPFYFNLSLKVAQEHFWFIDGNYRNKRDGIRLFNALEAWAREKGADIMSMASLSSSSNSVRKFYQRNGFYEQETNYLRRL